jgi:hypothetical protein
MDQTPAVAQSTVKADEEKIRQDKRARLKELNVEQVTQGMSGCV